MTHRRRIRPRISHHHITWYNISSTCCSYLFFTDHFVEIYKAIWWNPFCTRRTYGFSGDCFFRSSSAIIKVTTRQGNTFQNVKSCCRHLNRWGTSKETLKSISRREAALYEWLPFFFIHLNGKRFIIFCRFLYFIETDIEYHWIISVPCTCPEPCPK